MATLDKGAKNRKVLVNNAICSVLWLFFRCSTNKTRSRLKHVPGRWIKPASGFALCFVCSFLSFPSCLVNLKFFIMNYRNQLHPWCVMRLLPECQRVIMNRFRRQNDADAHRRILQTLMPEAVFVVIFEAPQPNSVS